MGEALTPAGGRWLRGTVVRARTGGYHLDFFPVAVGEIADVLVRHARPVIVVAGADYSAWAGSRAERGLPQLAAAEGVSLQAAYPDDGAIAVAGEDLPALLAGLHHWNLHCWDAPRTPRPSDVAPQVAAALHRHRRPGRGGGRRSPVRVLPRLAGAQWFVDSHDDSYLTVETGGPAGEELAQAVVARVLQEVVAGVVRAASWQARAAEVSAPPADAVAHLLTVAPEFELRPVAAPGKPGRVRVAFAALEPGADRWFGVHDFVPQGHLDYDPPTAGWRLRYH